MRTVYKAMALFCTFLPLQGAQGAQNSALTLADRTVAARELQAAIAAAKAGQAHVAQQKTEEILRNFPGYEPALKFEGALLEDAGQSTAAAVYFEQALQLDPNDPELLFSVGVDRLSKGQFGQAEALLAKGSELSPQDSQMFFYLAQAEHLTGHEEKALAASRRSVALDPASGLLRQKYGELLNSSGNNAEAYTELTRAQHLDPSLERIEYDLALVSLRKEDLEAADTYAAAAAHREPNNVRVLRLEAEIAAKLGHWPAAKELFEQILKSDPADTVSRTELGHSELALKQYGEAVETLKAVVQQEPTAVLPHFYLARAYSGLGMKAEAARENELHRELAAHTSAGTQP